VLVEIETAKSLVELPSPFSGTVGELLAPEGETVTSAPDHHDRGADAGRMPRRASPPTASRPPRAERGRRRRRARRLRHGRRRDLAPQAPRRAGGRRHASVGVVAKPPVRKLARDLGVDLARSLRAARPARSPATTSWRTPSRRASSATSRPRRARRARAHDPGRAGGARCPASAPAGGREETIPVKGVRKATASGMVRSAYTAPHVSVWTDVDATRTMELVKRLKASPDFADIKVSPLLIMARAVIWAVRRTPMVERRVDRQRGRLGRDPRAQLRQPRHRRGDPAGLLVPNIKDAQDLSMRELAQALEKLTLTAREGKTTPADQQGGTITITNIGVFGMDAGTPIINPGESGIVAMGTIRQKPWVVDGEVRPRFVTTVSGSFDHRVIDGDGMSRFIADVASILEEPALLLD
jgi:pyruvate dehydrogenase E2 component (dihydrolipoamide acetyltransferase)